MKQEWLNVLGTSGQRKGVCVEIKTFEKVSVLGYPLELKEKNHVAEYTQLVSKNATPNCINVCFFLKKRTIFSKTVLGLGDGSMCRRMQPGPYRFISLLIFP